MSKSFDNFSAMIIPTEVPGKSVHISKVATADGHHEIIGRAINADNGKYIKEIPPVRHKFPSEAQWENEVQYVVGRVVEKMQKVGPPVSRTSKSPVVEGGFAQAFLSIDDRESLCRASWAESTVISTLTYTMAVLKELDALDMGLAVSDADLAAVRNTMVDLAMKSGKSSKKLKTVTSGVYTRFARVGIVYENLQRVCTEYPLPVLRFPDVTAPIPIQTEQCKALPDEVRRKLAAKLRQRPNEGLALGAGLMFTVGPRTNEAAACFFGDIITDENGCQSLPILRQLRPDGKTTDILKSDAGYRLLPLPRFMTELISRRIHCLRELGYDEAAIKVIHVLSVAMLVLKNVWGLLLKCVDSFHITRFFTKKLLVTKEAFHRRIIPATALTRYALNDACLLGVYLP
ncbi:hypothetical protein LJC64_02945 [Ruminococcaceae bacterium OttesenSCG-928-A11]|nr:hypothetical protein [Ruminococcaceae bacterium OttesenSCG-928-A11]